MPRLWVRHALLTLLLALCATPLPLAAQDILTEEAAIERALAREGIAARDDADRDTARAGVAGITRFDNPQLSVSRESVNGDTEWQAGLVQPLDLSGRRGALRDAARSEAQAVERGIIWRRQELIAETRTAYVRCAAGGAELDIWRSFASDLAEARRIAEDRTREGDTAVYDLRRTRVALSSAQAELSMAEGERKAGCAKLAALTGADEPAIPPSAMTSLRSGEGSSDRADLAAQEQRLVAAAQRVTAARKARLPQLSVGAGVKRVDDPTGTAYGPTVSVGVTLPIFNGGGAAVAEAEARRRALEAELTIARRAVEAEQQAASARALAAREAAVSAAESRDDASRLGTIANTAYQAGEIGVVELLDAYEAQRDAELAVINHARLASEATIQFDLVTGRTHP